MKYNFHTDLAIETREEYQRINQSDIPGIDVDNETVDDVKITRVKVTSDEGAEAIGKAKGSYITLEVSKINEDEPDINDNISKIVAREIRKLIGNDINQSVLVVGLGNFNVTPDALGPKVVSYLDVTRHIIEFAPEYIKEPIRSVSAISPGVLGTTGIETGDIIKGVVEKTRPSLVIAIDALASRRLERISNTIQIADTGINPGSGVGNKRMGLSKETLGVPVIAIGVPTVVDAATMANDTIELMVENLQNSSSQDSSIYDNINHMGDEEKYNLVQKVLSPYVGNLVVTPKEIDAIIGTVSEVVANGINYALHSEEI